MRSDSPGHQRRWETEVCLLQAPSRQALVDRARDLVAALHGADGADGVELKDLAYTLNTEPRQLHASRLAVVAASVSELRARLAEAGERLADPKCRRIRDNRGTYYFDEPLGDHGSLAFLFPGEGAQYPGMLADVCIQFPEARAWFDLMDRAFIDHDRGYLPSELVFPREQAGDGSSAALWSMDGAVETVFAANQALLSILHRLDVRPRMVAGHSSGDYSALLAAGRLAISGDEQLVQHIRDLNGVFEDLAAIGRIPEAALLAVGTVRAEVVKRLVDEHAPNLAVALDNCPQQIVLCGSETVIGSVAGQLESEGAVTERLPFGRPYHTPLFAAFTDPLRAFFDRLDIRPSVVDVYSCVTAAPYPGDAAEVRELAVAQWTSPVRFRETTEAMHDAGARLFVEVGPRGNLTGFVENTLRGRPSAAVAMNTLQRSGLTQLNHAVGLLVAHGVPVNAAALYARRAPRLVPLDGTAARTRAGAHGVVPLSLRLPRLRLTDEQSARVTGTDDRSARATGSKARAPLASGRSALDAAPLASPPPRPETGGRALVMQEYFRSMERFLRVEREVMQAALARRPDSPPRDTAPSDPSPRAALPFIHRVVSIVPGREVVAACDVTLDDFRFLRDHTLGASVSRFDPDLVGLPVLPLAVSIEMVAECASLLRPDLVVVGARQVRAHRWIALESESLTLHMRAVAGDEPDEIRVEMFDGGVAEDVPGRDGSERLVEATILFADRHPSAERAGPLALRDESRSKWRAGDMYGRSGMFHGPSFQLVERIDRCGRDGAEATFVGRDARGWFRRTPSPRFLIDPMVLDAMGQVVGFWVGDRFERGLSVFPVRLERLDVGARTLAPGEEARCRVRVTHVDEDVVASDIDVVAADDTTMLRMQGWEDRRLDLPQRFYDFRIAPHEVLLSDEWPDATAGLAPRGVSNGCRYRAPRPLLEGHGGIWLRVLSHLVLGREERREWKQLATATVQRRMDWLAGRIAAKDAVRLLLRPRLGLLAPCDIEIAGDRNGRPVVRGPWTDAVGRAPHVTIAHSGGEALAIAIDADACDGIGVDVEQVGRVGEAVREVAFTGEETRWLAAVDDEARPEWATRVWCAKEAIGKALGCGLSGGGRDLAVSEFDRERGVLSLGLRGALERERPELSGRRFTARTVAEGSVVTATAVV